MIYFDNNATTKPAPEVVAAMLPFLTEDFGNPSSAYSFSRACAAAVRKARLQVAELVGASRPEEIYFTSGGTESDNWAIRGALAASPNSRHIITTRVEHEAVRKLCEEFVSLGYDVSWLDVDASGAIDLEQLRDELRPDTAVVSIMLANNETGVTFPVHEAAEIVKENSSALFHTDAVNAAGKIPLNVSATLIDLLSLSAHKFHGPKGAGALYVREGVGLQAQNIGGGQEMGKRAGTEAVHQIAGTGAAAELAADLRPMKRIAALRDRLEGGILRTIPRTSVNGSRSNRLPNTSNISFADTNGESILAALNDIGVFVSTGSACNEGDHTVSPVLKAMEIPFSEAMGSIRFSLGRFNTESEVELVLQELPDIVERLRRTAGIAA